MKKNTVTAEMIERIVSEGTLEVQKIGTKTTMVAFTTKEGFVITESSSCVDPVNYDVKMGTEVCMNHIKNKLWELEGYRLQQKVSHNHSGVEVSVKVNMDGLDEAYAKMQQLAGICKNTDTLQQRIIKGAERVEQIARQCTKADTDCLVPGRTVLYISPFEDKDCHAELLAVVRVEKALSEKRVGEAMCLIRKSGNKDTDIVNVCDIKQI